MHPPFRCVRFFRRKPLRIRVFVRVSSRTHKSNTIANAAHRRASGREEPGGGRRNRGGGRRWKPPARRSRNPRGEPRSWISAPALASRRADRRRKRERSFFRSQIRDVTAALLCHLSECHSAGRAQRSEGRMLPDRGPNPRLPPAGSRIQETGRDACQGPPASGPRNLAPDLAYGTCRGRCSIREGETR